METDLVSINYIVNETIRVMLAEQNKKSDWFNKIRKIQISDGTIGNMDKQEFLQCIIKLLLGDNPKSIYISKNNTYIEAWEKILQQVVDGKVIGKENQIENGSPEFEQLPTFLGMAFKEGLMEKFVGYSEILKNLTPEEVEVLETFVIWDGPFGPPQCEQFGLDKRVLDNLRQRNVITSFTDEEGDPWYHIPDQIQNMIKGKMSEDQIKEVNKKIARQLRRDLFKIQDSFLIRSAPMELIKNSDGSPISDEAADISESILINGFLEKVLFQTENIKLAQSIASITKKFIKHVIGGGQFYYAYFYSSLLSRAYLTWGMVDESEKVMNDLFEVWEKDDPKGMVETLNRINSSESSSSQGNDEKNITPEEYVERLNDRLGELRKENDIEGLARTTYKLSDFYFNFSKDMQKALDLNFQAEGYAQSCKNSFLIAAILQLRGKIYTAGEFLQEAKNSFEKALKIFRQTNVVPGVKETQTFLGVVLYQLNHFSDAIDSCQEAIQISMKYRDLETFIHASYFMAKSLEGLGENELALKVFKKIVEEGSDLDLDPGSNLQRFHNAAINEINLIQKA